MIERSNVLFKIFHLLLFLLVLAPNIALADTVAQQPLVQENRKNYVCLPTENSEVNLSTCINNIYLFSIGLAGFVAVLMFVYAGYLYMTGTAGSIKDAKDIMMSTIVALLILFGAYAFFNTINPGLTSISGIKLPEYEPPKIGTKIPGGGDTSRQCVPAPSSSPVSVAGLQGTCFARMGIADQASSISNLETIGGRNIPSETDKCADGNIASFGYFQINISAHELRNLDGSVLLDCPAAFTEPFAGRPSPCRVKTDPVSQDLYRQCVEQVMLRGVNINTACYIKTHSRRGWGEWSTYGQFCRGRFPP